MTLPAHTPVSTKVYRSSVQTVRLIAESKCMVCLSAWSLPSTWTEFCRQCFVCPMYCFIVFGYFFYGRWCGLNQMFSIFLLGYTLFSFFQV
jgi:hypothetical protein